MRAFVTAIAPVVIVVFLASTAHASVIHVVRQGDTINSVTMEYYGDASRALLIRTANQIPADSTVELAMGEPLLIPESTRRLVKSGETWADLAQSELGTPERDWYLAEVNGFEVSKQPTEGQIVSVPYLLPWSLTEGLAGTVSHFFSNESGRDRMQIARLLIKLNSGLRPRGVTRGTRIVIPFTDLNILPTKRAELTRVMAQRRTSSDQQSQSRATAQLEQLAALFDSGAYIELVRLGGTIAGASELTVTQQVTLHRYLGQTFIALDRPDLAAVELRALLALQPDFQFDQVTTSPVVIEFFERTRREAGQDRPRAVNQR